MNDTERSASFIVCEQQQTPDQIPGILRVPESEDLLYDDFIRAIHRQQGVIWTDRETSDGGTFHLLQKAVNPRPGTNQRYPALPCQVAGSTGVETLQMRRRPIDQSCGMGMRVCRLASAVVARPVGNGHRARGWKSFEMIPCVRATVHRRRLVT